MNNNTSRLGTEGVFKLIAKMSLPAIFSMLVQALYNIVDSFFVGMISNTNDEITALNYAFPLQMIFFAIALGIGVGANSLIARRLGEGKNQEASNAAQTGIILGACAFGITLICSFFLPQIFMKFYDKCTKNIEELAISYLSINMAFSFGMFSETIFNKILQSTGNMKVPMFSQLLGAITNIILDPIFIFKSGSIYTLPFGGEFKMPFGFGLGVQGAAIATVIGQIAAGVLVVLIALLKKHSVSLNFKGFKFSWIMIKQIFNVGIAVTIVNSINSFSTIILNLILEEVPVQIDGKDVAVGVTILGSYYKLQSFVFMPVFGLNQGVMPILGFNYGAKKAKRFNKTFLYSVIIALTILSLGLIMFQSIPKTLLTILSISGKELEYGTLALKIISLSFLAAAVNLIVSSLFQAVGHGIKSMFLNLLRQAGILIPLALIIALTLKDVNYVWIAFPIAEWLCMISFIPIIILTISKLNRIMNRTQEIHEEAL